MKRTFSLIRWLNSLKDLEGGPGNAGRVTIAAVCIFFMLSLFFTIVDTQPLNLSDTFLYTVAPWIIFQFSLNEVGVYYFPHLLMLVLTLSYLFCNQQRTLTKIVKLLLWLIWPIPICFLQLGFWATEIPARLCEVNLKLQHLDYDD
ncbi:hypothetical protein ACFL1U_01375 [Patescibacteria group bacterium]